MASALLPRLVQDRAASRLWARDLSLFAADAASVREGIAARLGWLQAPADMRQKLADVRRLAEGARRDGLRHVCLLGMGGSSLCAEVLRAVSPHGGRAMSLTVLDTTDERAINQETAAGSAGTTLFLVASKSGSTIEVTSLERHFGSVVTHAVGEPAAGGHFVAITDPGTAMVAHARTHRYRETFVNPADIGGRYSALSLFGLVPAALLDVDLDQLLDAGEAMARGCREDAAGNPGLALGAFMAENAAAGRDKLTLVVSPTLALLGVWIEQLVAESTGKDGRGLLPVVDEPEADPASYGADRVFVAIGAPGDGAIDTRASALAAAGHPVFRIQTSPEQLGAEFFRWEFATAIAGAALSVNPFDEPNVREAKARTQALLETFRTAGALRVDPPLKPKDGWLMRTHLAGDRPRRWTGRYIAVLDYLPADPARTPVISRLRRQLLDRTGSATTHGFGPRYLHSTGQYHKGGPNTGLFVLLTAADETTSMVPGTDYSFSVLKQAQALGDFEALVAAGREVIHVHFDAPGAGLASQVERIADLVTS